MSDIDQWLKPVHCHIILPLVCCLSPQGRSSHFPPSHFLPIQSVTDHRWRMTSVPSRRAPQAAGPNLVNIEVMRNRSELFRAVCSKLISGTEKQCKGMQNGDNMRLGKRTRMGSRIGDEAAEPAEVDCLSVWLLRSEGQRHPVYEGGVGAEAGGHPCGN